jgi:CheY-like chemotaxis protein
MVLNAGDAAIFADPGQIDQVLINLVVNARDAMPDGGTLTIETKIPDIDEPGQPEGSPHSWVAITIRDTGVGMDADTQRHLFEPYFTTKERGKGTGLGLSTIHGIIAQSGGHVQVESATGAGATFRIYLPKMEGPMPATGSSAGIVDLYGTESILAVEDEPQVRAYTVAALKAYGYRVLAAESAQAALLFFERGTESIDLVLTDLVMPNMSGRELAARLAQLRPSVKVLYCPASNYRTRTQKYSRWWKPFSPNSLPKVACVGASKPPSSCLLAAGESRRYSVCRPRGLWDRRDGRSQWPVT